jgi:hypothetical protein
MTTEEDKRAAEEWSDDREVLVEIPYSRTTVTNAIVSEQVASFLAGIAYARRWRKFPEEKPENGQCILVAMKNGHWYAGECSVDVFDVWVDTEMENELMKDGDHWQPIYLPKEGE